MENITSGSFKAHIESKESQTKQERANFLYGSYTFDCSLPQNWVNAASHALGISQDEIVYNFVWLYFDKNTFGQAAPLNLKGCEILEKIENLPNFD